MLKDYQFIPYSVSEIPAGPSLVFAPHPDDETFGLGGTILKMTDKKQIVNVVMMTDGAMGGAQEERREELRKATEILGVGECYFFGAPDQGLEVNPDTIQRVVDLIEKYQPRNVFFTSPLEYHPDHRATAWIVWNALQSIQFTGNVFSYEIANQSPVNTLVDISAVMERKTKAMKVYASQQAQLDFITTITSMNHLRTYTLPPKEAAYVEAFYRFENIRSDLMSYYYGNLGRYHGRMRSVALPLVSVLIRTKDRPELLRQALDSLARQTYRQIEINIVNDGTESVQHIVNDFVFSRIYLKNNKKPKGAARSANTLLKMAEGDYCIFLDDENRFDEKYIENLVQTVVENKNRLLCYGAVTVEQKSEESEYVNRSYIPALLRRLDYIPLNSVLFSKKLVENGCSFDKHFKMNAEWDFLLQLAQHSEFYYLDQTAAVCHVNRIGGEETLTGETEKEQWKLKIYDKWSKIWDATELNQTFDILEKLHSREEGSEGKKKGTGNFPDKERERLVGTIETQTAKLNTMEEENKGLKQQIEKLSRTNEIQIRRLREFQDTIQKSGKASLDTKHISTQDAERIKEENKVLKDRVTQLTITHKAQLNHIRELQQTIQKHEKAIADIPNHKSQDDKYTKEIRELKKRVETLSLEKAAKIMQLQKLKTESGTVDSTENKNLVMHDRECVEHDALLHQLLDERLAPINAAGEGKRDFKLVSPVGYEKELIELFEEVFKGPMSQEFWKWKYEGVQWRAVCALKDGKIIAHYNGMARDILYFGKHKRAIQPCDTMVSAKARGGIKTNSPFFSSTKAWILSNLGVNKEFLLTYGFPNDRHMRLGEKMGLYTEVDKVKEVDWYTKKREASPLINVDLFDYNKEMDKTINALWNTMADEFKENIIGIRDAQYLRRRYMKHPLIKYQTYLVYDEKEKLLGVFVLRIEDKLAALMDIIAPKAQFEMIINEAIRIAHNEGAKLLRAWVPESRIELFNHARALINNTDIVIPTISIVKGLNPEEIKGKWFLTYGDTDFM
ncbi:hypothetical protein YH65_01425 [Sulfurovum lithotrophicum]|uniref:Glycosyltransferase 2-like domain-containing protein n=1 Tax=Sulfurovum lithotrophicum TaxID=206403 RepID=A0A7U4LZP6_9BACT|nr:PIG-L family deacetylase [Sulfurovum lithotrophicum]AKF24204.1 hypothetical protein YH65_01425 [Sulfurovum lithotrophicum]